MKPAMFRRWFVSALTVSLGVAASAVGNTVGPDALLRAARTDDVATVRTLLAQHVDVNATEPDGTTALLWAADNGDAELFDVLMAAGADAKAVNRYGASAFHLACARGHAAIIERLLKLGASANQEFSGEAVLTSAVRAGRVDAVKVLLAYGADVNHREPQRQQTALMWAAESGNIPVMKVLLETGADVSARSKRIVAPTAHTHTDPPYIRTREIDPLGLNAHHDITINMTWEGMEFTPLLWAVRGGHTDAVKVLLDHGADVNDSKTDLGTSALILALINRHWELAGVLLDRGADPNHGPGYTALHQIAWSRRLNNYFGPKQPEATGTVDSLDIARKILDHGVQINARMTANFRDGYRSRFSRIGATAFLISSKVDDLPMMKLLIAHGADLSIANDYGDTPLMVAAGLEVHMPEEDPGTEGEAYESVKYLLELGMDINAVNLNNETAFHGAAYRGWNSVAQLLFDRGAKIDVANTIGWTPLRVADGVFYTAFLKPMPATAALIRTLLEKKGLPVPPPPALENDTDVLSVGGFNKKAEPDIDQATKEKAKESGTQPNSRK